MADDTKPPGSFRAEDFEEVYANNVQFESSVWDLKMIFGQLDQHKGRVDVEQHTAITIPWTQVKLLAHFLQINIFFHEKENGTIVLPPSVLPPDPYTNTALIEALKNDPNAKEKLAYMQQIRDALIASSKY